MSHIPPRPFPPKPPPPYRPRRWQCCQWCGRDYAASIGTNCNGCGAPRADLPPPGMRWLDVTTFADVEPVLIAVPDPLPVRR